MTGFGPFPGMTRNPSAEIARRVAASPRWRRLGVDARAAILTTSYAALEDELGVLLEENAFDALLMIGVAGRSKRVRIECRATNRVSVLFADAQRQRPARLRLGPGPNHRRSKLDATTISACLLKRSLPCRLSNDAGRYLCNAAYFKALATDRPVLFLHIPKSPRTRKRSFCGAWSRQAATPNRLGDAFVDVAVALLRHARLSRTSRAKRLEVAAPDHDR